MEPPSGNATSQPSFHDLESKLDEDIKSLHSVNEVQKGHEVVYNSKIYTFSTGAKIPKSQNLDFTKHLPTAVSEHSPSAPSHILENFKKITLKIESDLKGIREALSTKAIVLNSPQEKNIIQHLATLEYAAKDVLRRKTGGLAKLTSKFQHETIHKDHIEEVQTAVKEILTMTKRLRKDIYSHKLTAPVVHLSLIAEEVKSKPVSVKGEPEEDFFATLPKSKSIVSTLKTVQEEEEPEEDKFGSETIAQSSESLDNLVKIAKADTTKLKIQGPLRKVVNSFVGEKPGSWMIYKKGNQQICCIKQTETSFSSIPLGEGKGQMSLEGVIEKYGLDPNKHLTQYED